MLEAESAADTFSTRYRDIIYLLLHDVVRIAIRASLFVAQAYFPAIMTDRIGLLLSNDRRISQELDPYSPLPLNPFIILDGNFPYWKSYTASHTGYLSFHSPPSFFHR